MFKKRTNFRKKASAEDGGGTADEPVPLEVDGSAAKSGTGTKRKKKVAPAGGAALLSFEDDEADADVFQTKKSKTKKRSMRAPDALTGGDTADASARSGGDYSLERLREMANAQKGFAARPSEHNLVDDVSIPDAAAISAAKARREQMRKAGADGTHGDQSRVTSERGAGASFPRVEQGDEDARWEDEQLRRAMRVGNPAAATDAAKKRLSIAMGAGARGRGTIDSRAEDIAAAGARAMADLRAALSSADASRRAAVEEVKRAEAAMASSESLLKTHEERLASAGERYKYMQELRDYFRDLCHCLHDKDPIIQELEAHARRLHEQRGAAATLATDAERKDDRVEAEAAVAAAQEALARGESRYEALAAANAAAETAVAASLGDAQELDDLGRDVGAVKRRAAETRAVTRAARRAREEAGEVPVGEADDAESPEEIDSFLKGWDDVREAGACVMRDAGSEYASIGPVKARSEDWKKRFPKTYHDAWMSHSAPLLFAPFVRLQLLAWSPLHGSGSDGAGAAVAIDGMAWYSDLFDYGMGEGAGEDDADCNLVPTLVEKLIAPVVEHAIERCWDASSVTQSRRLAGVAKEMLVYLEPGTSDAMARILVAAKAKLRESAEKRCDVPAWAPVVTTAAPAAERHARRQFGVALRCARAAMAWNDTLTAADVSIVVRDDIMDRRVAPYLRLLLARPGECLDGLERAVATIPREWLTPVRGIASTLAQLVRSTPEVHSAVAAAADSDGKIVDPRRLVKVLAGVGDFDEAQAVAKAFGVSAKDGA